MDLTIEAAPVVPTNDSANTENITVGSSSGYLKQLELPRDNMYVSHVPVNQQKVTSKDSFSVWVSGRTLYVWNVGTWQGWNQNLVLRTITNPEAKPKPPVIKIVLASILINLMKGVSDFTII